MQNCSVGIACYNQEATIAEVVEVLQEVLCVIAKENEIIIVDDCSTDSSRIVIEGIERAFVNVKTIFHKKHRGIGATINDIYINAKYENVVFVPGDAQFDPTELLRCSEVEDNTYISFYRIEHDFYSRKRAAISFINKSINKYFLGLELYDATRGSARSQFPHGS